jgi:hypothetical protein
MRTLTIGQITLDEDGRLLLIVDLRPGESLESIYRAGMEIGWRPTERALSSPVLRPGGWSYSDWFRQMLRAVTTEYGAKLVIDGNTIWSVPQDVRQQIESAI